MNANEAMALADAAIATIIDLRRELDTSKRAYSDLLQNSSAVATALHSSVLAYDAFRKSAAKEIAQLYEERELEKKRADKFAEDISRLWKLVDPDGECKGDIVTAVASNLNSRLQHGR